MLTVSQGSYSVWLTIHCISNCFTSVVLDVVDYLLNIYVRQIPICNQHYGPVDICPGSASDKTLDYQFVENN